MLVVCLDLEGVLVPEIWIAFAEKTGIAEFRRTTRDEPDYDKLRIGRSNALLSGRWGALWVAGTVRQGSEGDLCGRPSPVEWR